MTITLDDIESRALLYQSVLLESDINKKIELMKLLKESFTKDKIGAAFEEKLKKLLQNIELLRVLFLLLIYQIICLYRNV